MPRHAVMVLAMLAALVMAPSSAFAAANELRNPAVSPPEGTTVTVFVTSVGYHSSAGNPADGVTATVAGRTVTLSLTSGSAVDGIWTGTTTLPAGSWMVAFRASASRGPNPSGSIGPVTVAQVPPPSPAGSQPSGDTADPGDGSTTAEPKPKSSAKPSHMQPAAPVSSSATPSDGAAPAASDTADPGRAGPGNAAPHRRSIVASASSSPAGAAASDEPTAGEDEEGDQAAGGELLNMVLLLGFAGVAAVAMLGAAWIILVSRRDRPEPSVAVAAAVEPTVPGLSTVEQRAMRRARLRPSDDPILAALGLSDEEPPSPGDAQDSKVDQGASPRRFRKAARSPRPEN
jgi:hypothetical protein